jgi:hypothetical protein
MKRSLFFLMAVFTAIQAQAQYTFSGYVYDARNREALPGATVYHAKSQRGASTNAYGFYSLTLPDSTAELRYSFVGFTSKNIRASASKSMQPAVLLDEQNTFLEDVVVVADAQVLKDRVKSTTMGSIGIKPVEVSRIASFAGESDLIKVLQLMPGVTPGHEGQTGMFVRGGTDDQNLILLDEATVYNAAHLLGFFSVFNTDAINDVQIEKGPFAPRYGGRLSSVVDVRMKEGSASTWRATGGVGLLTSRLTLEGPVVKDRSSFMLAGRRTYIDRVFGAAGIPLPYYFYDMNAKWNYRLSEQDRVFVSGYFGDDILDIQSEEENNTTDEDNPEEEVEDFSARLGFKLGNRTYTTRWNHVYDGGKLFRNITWHHTRFQYDIFGKIIDNSVLIRSRIRDNGVKAGWEFFPESERRITFGADAVFHQFQPNIINTSGEIEELVESQKGRELGMLETAVHAGDDVNLSEALRLSYGLRWSAAFTGSKVYAGPEPRMALRWLFSRDRSLKFGYSLMRQYMHRVSSTAVALPTDLWYPVTETVAPQRAHQFSFGWYQAFVNKGISFSVESYFKRMYQLIEYREGARLLLNDNFERELLDGDGRSFGVEWFLRKETGKLTGWLSYTLSKTERQFTELNGGRPYPDRFDRRHAISAVGMLELAPDLFWSWTWVYMSGSRITVQNGQFLMPNPTLTGVDLLPVYTTRNAVTLAPTHRLDVNLILKRPQRKYGRGEWHLSAYNFYNRASPYQISIQANGAGLEYVQRGLFGFIPSIAYNFSFSSR